MTFILQGYGYLPIDLNLYSDTFGDISEKMIHYIIFVEGKSSNLDFITNYFDEVDDAPGDYTLALELSWYMGQYNSEWKIIRKQCYSLYSSIR